MVCPLRQSHDQIEEIEGAVAVNWCGRRRGKIIAREKNYKIRFVYLITQHLYVSTTRDWEPDSRAPVALRCDVTTLCQRLPSRLIIWLAALTKMVDQRTKSVTNPPQAAIFHPLVWLTSLWTPPADFHVIIIIIMGWTLLCWCDKSLCLFVTAELKPHHISFWWFLRPKQIIAQYITFV